MTPRTTSKKAATIDPVKVCVLALKQVKSSGDYHQIGSVNPVEVLATAWGQLTAQEQQRITNIVNTDTLADAKTIANELMACGTRIELESVKGHYRELLIKQAWKLLPQSERDRIKALCDNGQKEEPLLVIEQAAVYKVETQLRRSLFNISDDLQLLNDLLDNCGDDSQQQQLVNQLVAGFVCNLLEILYGKVGLIIQQGKTFCFAVFPGSFSQNSCFKVRQILVSSTETSGKMDDETISSGRNAGD